MKRKFLAVTMTFLTAMMLCTGCGSQETQTGMAFVIESQ